MDSRLTDATRCFRVPMGGSGDMQLWIEFVGRFSDRAFETFDGRLRRIRNWRKALPNGMGCDAVRLASLDTSWLADEIDVDSFQRRWDESVSPRLSQYSSGPFPATNGLFDPDDPGPRRTGSAVFYDEYFDEDYAIRGFTVWSNGCQPGSLLPVPPGCRPVSEDSLMESRLWDKYPSTGVDSSVFEELWREGVLTQTRHYRTLVPANYKWREPELGLLNGPGRAYQKVIGRWIVDEWYVADREPVEARRPVSPTQMEGWLPYEEISDCEFENCS